jgi:putative ABC transport system permease protein
LLKHPQVSAAGVSIFSFAENAWVGLGFTDDKKVYKSFQYNAVDPDFVRTMKLRIIQGRSFDPGNAADVTNAALVNEAFLKEFNIANPIGKKLPGKFDQQIIGVLKDFNFQSLHENIQPLLLTIKPDSIFRRTENISFAYSPQPRVSVRLKGGEISNNLKVLRESWQKIAPNQDFEYQFLDDALASQYKQETKTDTIVKLASSLSIFIACMGLFGLATLAVVRRTKEIGIRKVMGATVGNIVMLVSREFVKLVIIAAVIAFPIAWWFLKDWLKDFSYRINISWWIYIIAATAAMGIALCTVSFQAIRAALSNPVKALRTE